MTDEYPYDDMFSLQPLVDRVTVEKKVFDALQKNNLDLMKKLETAKEALLFYADDENFCINMDGGIEESDGSFIGTMAQKTLKELENDE